MMKVALGCLTTFAGLRYFLLYSGSAGVNVFQDGFREGKLLFDPVEHFLVFRLLLC